MKNTRNKLRVAIFSALLFLGCSVGAHAQTPVPTPDPVLQACEETADLAKRLTIENTSLKAQLDIANQKISLRDQQVGLLTDQIQFYKKIGENNNQIDVNSQLIIQNLRAQVADDQVRIKDLDYENKSLRRSRDFRTVVGFGAGFATGYFTRK